MKLRQHRFDPTLAEVPEADLALKRSAANRIEVTARDAFGQQVVRHVTVHQRPAPVVIVPGWGTSGPDDLFNLPEYLRRRGYPADRLAVLSVASTFVYGGLQDSLAAAGYVRGRDQFIVPYDWRLPIAPSDGVRDGVLAAVTAESMLQPQPAFSLGYLGTFLKRLVVNDTPDANHLLLDLNAGSVPGVNPWTSLVRQATVTYGEHPRALVSNRPITTETFVRAVVADGQRGSVQPFQVPNPITPPAGSISHVRERLPAGDDTVPAVSLRATSANDPTIVVRAWGNGAPAIGQTWTPTTGSVRHAGFLGNPDVLAFIRRRIRPIEA